MYVRVMSHVMQIPSGSTLAVSWRSGVSWGTGVGLAQTPSLTPRAEHVLTAELSTRSPSKMFFRLLLLVLAIATLPLFGGAASAGERMPTFSMYDGEDQSAYFFPERARRVWSEATTRAELFATTDHVTEEVRAAYLGFWDDVMEDAHLDFLPEQRAVMFARHPLAAEFKELHDMWMMINTFNLRVAEFPAGRMTWDDWADSQRDANCASDESFYNKNRLFNCLPIQNWLREDHIALIEKIFGRGEAFRYRWRTGPCSTIAEKGDLADLSQELNELWEDERCDMYRRYAYAKYADYTHSGGK